MNSSQYIFDIYSAIKVPAVHFAQLDVKTGWLKHNYFHYNLQMFHKYISILNLTVSLRHIEFTA